MKKRSVCRAAGRLSALLLAAFAGVGLYQALRPLPGGIAYRGDAHAVPAAEVAFLADLTYETPGGAAASEQEIFDAAFALIDGAEEYVLVDMFLFNDFTAGSGPPARRLADELTAHLVARKRARPSIRIDFVTDPINTVYGGARAPQIEALRAAGVNVVVTDLRRLRDSNPLYSAPWRTLAQWFGNSRRGGLLPHPFSAGGARVTLRSYLAMLNFKANHRKVVVADAEGGMHTLVTSANPHDGSSAHSNVALMLPGGIWRDVYEAEAAIARFSGTALSPPPAPAGGGTAPAGEGAEVVLLTESRIEEELLEALDGAGAGDDVRLATFYLADREVIAALLGAARRGADVRIVLDPNRDAFGYRKNGVPNRPVAAELVARSGGRIRVRWYRTRGEQFHVKMTYVGRSTGEAVLVLGSANLTRRNLDDYNLEMDLKAAAPAGAPPMAGARDFFERIWENRGGVFTVPYEDFADDSLLKKLQYRLQESSGVCSF